MQNIWDDFLDALRDAIEEAKWWARDSWETGNFLGRSIIKAVVGILVVLIAVDFVAPALTVYVALLPLVLGLIVLAHHSDLPMVIVAAYYAPQDLRRTTLTVVGCLFAFGLYLALVPTHQFKSLAPFAILTFAAFAFGRKFPRWLKTSLVGILVGITILFFFPGLFDRGKEVVNTLQALTDNDESKLPAWATGAEELPCGEGDEYITHGGLPKGKVVTVDFVAKNCPGGTHWIVPQEGLDIDIELLRGSRVGVVELWRDEPEPAPMSYYLDQKLGPGAAAKKQFLAFEERGVELGGVRFFPALGQIIRVRVKVWREYRKYEYWKVYEPQ